MFTGAVYESCSCWHYHLCNMVMLVSVKGYAIMVLNCVSLLIDDANDNEHIFMFTGHLYIGLCKVSLQVFCPLLEN